MSPRRIGLGALLYGAMTLLAVGIGWLRETPLVTGIVTPAQGALPASPLVTSLCAGLVLALLTTTSSRWLVRRSGWARALRARLRPFLLGATPLQLALLALLSGVAEELFFRGALLPWIGIVLSSLVFGAMHIGPTRDLLPWTVWAIVMGFLFGAIVVWTGELAGAIVAHVAINAVNLRLVADFDGALDREPVRTPTPTLVGRQRVASAEHRSGPATPKRAEARSA